MFCGVSGNFSPPPAAIYIQRSCPFQYGVCFACVGGSTHYNFLDRVESMACGLISYPLLTDCLQPLIFRLDFASLSVLYRFFHAYCSFKLAACQRPRCTQFSTDPPSLTIQISYASVNWYLFSFIPFTVQLWNHLPMSVFCPFYDLQFFKKGVSGHLSI